MSHSALQKPKHSLNMNTNTDNARTAINNKLDLMSEADKVIITNYVGIYISKTDQNLVAFECRNPIDLHDNLMKKHRGQLFFAYFIPKNSRVEAETFVRDFNKQQKLVKAVWSEGITHNPELATMAKY